MATIDRTGARGFPEHPGPGDPRRIPQWLAGLFSPGDSPLAIRETLRAALVHVPALVVAILIADFASCVVLVGRVSSPILPAACTLSVLLLASIAWYARLESSSPKAQLSYIHLATALSGLTLVGGSIAVADSYVGDPVSGIVLICLNATAAILISFAFAPLPAVGILQIVLVGAPGLSKILYDRDPDAIAVGFMFLGICAMMVQMIARANGERHENIAMRQELFSRTMQAQSSDRAKSEFLANMSHEIRTPMNGVMGMAELLAKTPLDARQKTFVDIIVKSGAALLTIINDILDFSKIDAGQMELDPAPFRLAEAIEDVAALVSSRVAEKDLELAVRVDPALPDMYVGDVGRIRQIVTNLMGNAVKFTERGHVLVEVSGEAREEGRWLLRFRVEDTGIGIPPEMRQRIFAKFSQVDASATRRHEGTGLGLAISSSLVELMGGKIGYESEPGKGSTFHFEVELPAHDGEKRKRRIPTDATGARVLVVDDNAVNRAILMEQLTAWRFDAAAARNGAEALAVLEAASASGMRVDLVVLDYHMPAMNGAETLSALRTRLPALADLPVIMLTSVDHTEDGRPFSALGVAAHLIKPARSSLLLETILSALAEAAARRREGNGAAAALAALVALGAHPKADPAALATGEPPGDARALQRSLAEALPHEPVAASSGDEPAADGAEAPAGASGNADADAPGYPGAKGKIDILVAEDNEVNRVVFTQILDATPWSYVLAGDGEEAVARFRELSPALMLFDVSMPRMNGLDAAKAVRAAEAALGRPRSPIVAVTAHALKGDMDRCLEAGMDDYLTKPVSPARLEAVIAKWLPGQAAGDSRPSVAI